MKRFCLLLVAIVGASAFSPFASVYYEEWETYKIKFGKSYTRQEDSLRMRAFLDHKLKVADHNQRFYEGKETFRIGVNQFSDRLPHELRNINGLKFDAENIQKKGATFIPPHNDVKIPASIDWRKEGAVAEVKNQGLCGSCWAFSATGCLEGQHFRKTGKLVSLSEQNLVDCVIINGTRDDCSGGLMTDAYEYIKENGGIDTEKSYPYEAQDGKCHFSTKNIGATDKGYVELETFNEEQLLQAVATVGPISVAIEATDALQAYSDGLFYDPTCSSYDMHSLNHGVLVVGYGTTEDGQDYWLVKNSWGAHWGMDGYFKIVRGKGNNCGIASLASYPLV